MHSKETAAPAAIALTTTTTAVAVEQIRLAKGVPLTDNSACSHTTQGRKSMRPTPLGQNWRGTRQHCPHSNSKFHRQVALRYRPGTLTTSGLVLCFVKVGGEHGTEDNILVKITGHFENSEKSLPILLYVISLWISCQLTA